MDIKLARKILNHNFTKDGILKNWRYSRTSKTFAYKHHLLEVGIEEENRTPHKRYWKNRSS